jgi:hypothetical protein
MFLLPLHVDKLRGAACLSSNMGRSGRHTGSRGRGSHHRKTAIGCFDDGRRRQWNLKAAAANWARIGRGGRRLRSFRTIRILWVVCASSMSERDMWRLKAPRRVWPIFWRITDGTFVPTRLTLMNYSVRATSSCRRERESTRAFARDVVAYARPNPGGPSPAGKNSGCSCAGLMTSDLGKEVESPRRYRFSNLPRSITWIEVKMLQKVDRPSAVCKVTRRVVAKRGIG